MRAGSPTSKVREFLPSPPLMRRYFQNGRGETLKTKYDQRNGRFGCYLTSGGTNKMVREIIVKYLKDGWKVNALVRECLFPINRREEMTGYIEQHIIESFRDWNNVLPEGNECVR